MLFSERTGVLVGEDQFKCSEGNCICFYSISYEIFRLYLVLTRNPIEAGQIYVFRKKDFILRVRNSEWIRLLPIWHIVVGLF